MLKKLKSSLVYLGRMMGFARILLTPANASVRLNKDSSDSRFIIRLFKGKLTCHWQVRAVLNLRSNPTQAKYPTQR
ncbi:MAG: hypothetical protein ACREGJ_03320 [Candidatus Saccharimonadales bacterium]